MLKPIITSFRVDDSILKDIISFFFLFSKDKILISDEYLLKQIADKMDEDNAASLRSKILLNQSFDLFYKYLNVFLENFVEIPKILGSHIEFSHSRKIVWKFIEFLISKSENYQIKKNILINHLSNNEIYFDSEPFSRFVKNIIDEVISSEYKITIENIENVFFVISKLVSINSFITANNVLVESVNSIVSSNEVAFDMESVTKVQNVIENMGNRTLSSFMDEMILNDEEFDVNLSHLNYPIVPVKAFSRLKFFQEKRVFLFVGASGIGKSMILCHITADMWLNTIYKKAPKEVIFYFTMENLKEEVASRIIANAFYSKCGFNLTIDDVMANKFTANQRNVLLQLVKDSGREVVIEFLPPRIHGCRTLTNVVKKRILEKKVVPYAIVIDYLDLMKCENVKMTDEHQQLGEIVNEIKSLAVEFSVPVISASHLNAEGCKMVKEDMGSLGGRQMGKSLRKYENADGVTFVDEEPTPGLSYSIMNCFNSKHRYMRRGADRLFGLIYLPEYSYLELMDKKKIERKSIASAIDDENMIIQNKPDKVEVNLWSDDNIGL